MVYAVALIAWLAVGAIVGVLDARRGGWHRGWVVSALIGPVAIPLALRRAHWSRPAPTVLTSGRPRRGPVDLLIGFDGSSSSLAAATLAVELLGPRVRRVTLATVLDADTAAPHADNVMFPEPWPEETLAREQLAAAAKVLAADLAVVPGSVILAGAPAEALERYAIDEDYEVVVVGCRGKGLTKLVLGSCASTLASKTHVPVLLVPAEAATVVASGPSPRSR